MSEIQERIGALETQLADLRAQVGGAPTEVLASRRDFAKKAALGVAGLAAAGVAGAVAAAGPASATDGLALLVGVANTEDVANLTALQYNNAVRPTAGLFGTQNANAFTVTDAASGGIFFSPFSSEYPAALGGWGERIFANGVYGFANIASGYGTIGYGSGDGSTGVLARGAGRANLELYAAGNSGPARAVAHNLGEVVNDSTGTVWLCVAAGTPGTWRQVGGPSTAGQLHLVTPGRVYDSRFDPTGKHVFGAADRVVTATTVIAGQPGAGSVIVPAGATGILGNLTITATESAGFLGLYSNAVATWPGNSSINWVASNVDLANAVTVAIDATGKIKVNIGGQGVATKTHFIVDVVGYYA
ncbi:MAG: hypothetical protein ABJD24_13065 [Acidimicrobiales bacterium]